MRANLYLLVIGLCASAAGCRLVHLAACNLAYEAHVCTGEAWEDCRSHWLAKSAWKQAQADCPEHQASADYARGFQDGFADYVENGGTGEPPPLPPRRYWTTWRERVNGHQTIDDWYAGFRHGSGAARAGGYREVITIPCPIGHPAVPEFFDHFGPMPVEELPHPRLAPIDELPHSRLAPTEVLPRALPEPRSEPRGNLLPLNERKPRARLGPPVIEPLIEHADIYESLDGQHWTKMASPK